MNSIIVQFSNLIVNFFNTKLFLTFFLLFLFFMVDLFFLYVNYLLYSFLLYSQFFFFLSLCEFFLVYVCLIRFG